MSVHVNFVHVVVHAGHVTYFVSYQSSQVGDVVPFAGVVVNVRAPERVAHLVGVGAPNCRDFVKRDTPGGMSGVRLEWLEYKGRGTQKCVVN